MKRGTDGATPREMLRLRRFVPLALGLLSACGSHPEGGEPQSRDAGTESGLDEPGSQLTERQAAVAEAASAVSYIAHAQQILSLFVRQDSMLDLQADACANARSIAARLSTAEGRDPMCALPVVTCAERTALLRVSMVECYLSEVPTNTVSGEVTVEVAGGMPERDATLAVSLSFVELEVDVPEQAPPYPLAGSISTTTSDLQTYTMVADLTFPEFAITFQGRSEGDERSGALVGTTLHGSGRYAGATSTEGGRETECMSSTFDYVADNLQASDAACTSSYGGDLTVERSYECAAASESATPSPRTRRVQVVDVIRWSDDTANIGDVQVTTTITAGSEVTKSKGTAFLPVDCHGDG